MLRFSGEREIFFLLVVARTDARTHPQPTTHNPSTLYWCLTDFSFFLFPHLFFCFLFCLFCFFVGDALGVRRFLRARKFDVPKAKAMLLSAEQWRKDENVDELVRCVFFLS